MIGNHCIVDRARTHFVMPACGGLPFSFKGRDAPAGTLVKKRYLFSSMGAQAVSPSVIVYDRNPEILNVLPIRSSRQSFSIGKRPGHLKQKAKGKNHERGEGR